PTVSIACLFGSAEEAFLDAAGQRRLRLEDLSDLGGVKQVLRREVRVSGHRVCTYFQRAGVPSEWRAVWDRSALLRNVYPAFFDGEGKLVTAGAEQGPPEFSLRVDPELGIVIAYAAEEE
ncbi:MAG: hypothetical protein N2512_13275, partial [Armatimonadetes bacterium]|nr:hypothetical protein [Armatimonadota bacterium]